LTASVANTAEANAKATGMGLGYGIGNMGKNRLRGHRSFPICPTGDAFGRRPIARLQQNRPSWVAIANEVRY
jgi:hypothetical protein